MAQLAIFGIKNDGLNLAANLFVLFLVAIYIALIVWTYADAKRRIEDQVLVTTAAAASLFPFVGTLIYVIVRPPEFLEDARERDLEIAAAEARLAQVEVLACPYCDFEIEKGFLRCPSCLRRLKEPCAACGKPLDPRWKICPYCEAEVGQAPRQERARRPRAAPAAREPAAERQPTAAKAAASAGGAQSKRPVREAATGGDSARKTTGGDSVRKKRSGERAPAKRSADSAARPAKGKRTRPPTRPPSSAQ
jgi:double zinc ribbon protein